MISPVVFFSTIRFACPMSRCSPRLGSGSRSCANCASVLNLPGEFNTLAQLAQLLDPLPSLGLHLDIGHANLMVEKNTTGEIIETYGSRLRHVHLHDNKG